MNRKKIPRKNPLPCAFLLFIKTKEHFGGGIDFILHAPAMSINVRKGIHYTENNYEFTHKGLDISALSLHRVLASAMKHDAINEWGSVVALTYIAAQRIFPVKTSLCALNGTPVATPSMQQMGRSPQLCRIS